MSNNILRYEFENYAVLPAERLLLRDGEAIHLKPKVLETLLTLITHQGQLLSKNELMRLIWAGNFVEEGNLSQNIFTLRKIFGESPKEHRFIVTVPGQGYRFVKKVREVTDSAGNNLILTESKDHTIKSLLVLPFKFFSAVEDEKYLGLAIADTLITQLSTNKSISIFSTAAIIQYIDTDKNPLTIGQELLADAVISGTIQRFSQKFRINVQITQTANSETLWANIFEVQSEDLILLQDQVADEVANILTIKLNQDSRHTINRLKNQDVYQLFLKGRYYWEKRTEAGLLEALSCAQQVASVEPEFPLAYVGIADSYLLLGEYLYKSPEETFPPAKDAIDKVLEIDSSLSEPYASLAEYKFFYEKNWRKAEEYYRLAIELNPNYASAHHWYSWFLISMGRFHESQEQIEKAQRLDPNSINLNTIRGLPFFYRKEYDRAIEHFKQILEFEPELTHAIYYHASALAHSGKIEKAIEEFEKLLKIAQLQQYYALLGYCYGIAGQRKKAKEMLEFLKNLANERYVSPYTLAIVYVGLGETTLALQSLERALQTNAVWLVWLKVDPYFDSLRNESRFKEIIAKLDFPFVENQFLNRNQ